MEPGLSVAGTLRRCRAARRHRLSWRRLAARVAGQPLRRCKVLANPFLVRTAEPPLSVAERQARVEGVERLAKRIVFALEGELFLVLHLMIAGRCVAGTAGAQAAGQDGAGGVRLRDRHADADRGRHEAAGVAAPGRGRGAARSAHDPGGLDVLAADLAAFAAALARENHTLKRALTDPRLFSGIGNAYSDEILHRARMSPLALTARSSDEEIERLFDAAARC